MMKRFRKLVGVGLFVTLTGAVFTTSALAQVQDAKPNSEAAKTYVLRYKLKKGETICWDVEHIATTKTKMAGESEDTSSKSVSRKFWKVVDVDAEGNMRFQHSIESVDMWQQIGDDEPISYNSKIDKKVPFEYESTAAHVGKVLAELKMTPDGLITERKTDLKEVKFGVGDIAVPFPKQAIPIGQKWNVPTVLNAVDDDKRSHELKARLAYQLVKVVDGNAYIVFRTEILTPVESAKIESQIMQQKTKGYLVFDIQNGRMIRKDIEWNEKVQGFEGDESYLEYVAKMTERIVDEQTQQVKSVAPLTPLKSDAASAPREAAAPKQETKK